MIGNVDSYLVRPHCLGLMVVLEPLTKVHCISDTLTHVLDYLTFLSLGQA